MGGNVVHIGERRNSCNILVGKLERKRQLGKPSSRWEIILD
jgi:hypothetical protein